LFQIEDDFQKQILDEFLQRKSLTYQNPLAQEILPLLQLAARQPLVSTELILFVWNIS